MIRLTQDFHLQSALISTPACYLFHITIWLYTYSGRVSEHRIQRCQVLLLGRTQNFSFFFFFSRSWEDSNTSFLSLFFYQFVILVQETVLRKNLRNKNSWTFFVILAASFPNIVDPWWNKFWKFNFPRNLRWVTGKGKIKEHSGGVFFNYLNRFMPRRLYLSSCDVRNLASCAYSSLQYHIRQCILILITV